MNADELNMMLTGLAEEQSADPTPQEPPPNQAIESTESIAARPPDAIFVHPAKYEDRTPIMLDAAPIQPESLVAIHTTEAPPGSTPAPIINQETSQPRTPDEIRVTEAGSAINVYHVKEEANTE